MNQKILKKEIKTISSNELQNQLIDRFISNINKSIKNDLFLISYREILDEGMTSASFYHVIDILKKTG